ncbi:Uncharacterized protein (Fragment), partial [Durusdinium trenchii]
MIREWNSCQKEAQELVERQNQELVDRHERGELTAAALAAGLQDVPETLAIPSKQWCRKFRINFGWSLLSRGGDTQAYLPYAHPDMQASRDHMAATLADGVHGALVLNFDQVWRCAFQFNGRLFYKPREAVGERCSIKKAPHHVDKKLHYIKGCRKSLTVLTSSWSDGTPGPIAFCCPDGALSVSEIQEFNASHVASAMVVPSGTNSHFMTSDTLLQVWEQLYSPALAKQRSRYGLKLDDPGAEAAFLADAWSGTHSSSKGEDARRRAFCKLHRIREPRKQPGGWSCHGQPVDQCHMQYREKIRSLDVSSLSMHADLRSRAAFEEVSMRASGQLVREVKSWLSVVNLSLDAWRQLDQKVFQSAWLLCGYFGEEHFAKYQGSGVSSVTFDDAMKILSSPFGPLKGTPQRCTVFEWQVQVESGEWQSMSYELASAFVRTLMLHGAKLRAARNSFLELSALDEHLKKAATKKAKQEFENLKSVSRYMVFNPRTGELASQQWLNNHIQVMDGVPCMKKKLGKACPFIVTLGFDLLPVGDVKLTVKTAPDKPVIVDEEEMDDEGANDEDFLWNDEDGLQGSEKVKMAPLADKEMELFGEEESDSGEVLEQAIKVDPSEFIQMHLEEKCASLDSEEKAVAVAIKQPSFFKREAFVALHAAGLTEIPNKSGVHIWCHQSSSQWHAQYPGKSYSPSWGATRSEQKALGLALLKLWAWFVKDHPENEAAK